MPSQAPTLTTPRLTLRPHSPEDFAACCALWGDERVTRYIGGRPNAPDEVWARILRYGGLWAMLGFGYWLIEETESGKMAGEAGLADNRRGLGPIFDRWPEAGWALTPGAQGKGYAQEAMEAILAWAEREGIAATVCMIHPANAPSLKVAEKLGYAAYAETLFKGTATVLLRR